MEFINGLSAIVFLVSVIAFLLGMIKPKLLKLQGRKQVALVTAVIFIGSLIVFSITTSDEQKAEMNKASEQSAKERELAQKQEKESEAAEKLDKLKKQINLITATGSPELITNVVSVLEGSANSIEKTEIQADSVDIYLKAKPIWDEKQTVFDSGMKGAEIISKLKEKGVSDLKTVRIHTSTELLDKYDNKFNERVFFIEYDYPEVLKLNSDSYVFYQPYLRFAKMNIIHPVARKALNDWCNDGSNASLSKSFCLTAN